MNGVSPAIEHGVSNSHATAPSLLSYIMLHGVRFANVTEAQCVDFVMREIDTGRGGWIMTPNLDILRMLASDRVIQDLTSEVDMFVADGMPLIWASRLQGTPLPERVCGSNLIYSLSEAAAQHGRSIFLLGGDPGTAEGAADLLRKQSPALKIAGSHCPPMGFQDDPAEMKRITDLLEASAPDIIFVALGCPKQEQLIDQLRAVIPSAWWLGIGISFSYATGDLKRAPKWLQRIGLEWVYRLVQDPRRMFSRYIIHDIPFAIKLFSRSFVRRFSRSPQNEVG